MEHTIYVGGLAPKTTEKDLKGFFGRRLSIKRIDLNDKHVKMFSSIRGVPLFAFITFDCGEEQLKEVLAYNKCYWHGSYLRVQRARKPKYVFVPGGNEEERSQADASQTVELHLQPQYTLHRIPKRYLCMLSGAVGAAPASGSASNNMSTDGSGVARPSSLPTEHTLSSDQASQRKKRVRILNTTVIRQGF